MNSKSANQQTNSPEDRVLISGKFIDEKNLQTIVTV